MIYIDYFREYQMESGMAFTSLLWFGIRTVFGNGAALGDAITTWFHNSVPNQQDVQFPVDNFIVYKGFVNSLTTWGNRNGVRVRAFDSKSKDKAKKFVAKKEKNKRGLFYLKIFMVP